MRDPCTHVRSRGKAYAQQRQSTGTVEAQAEAQAELRHVSHCPASYHRTKLKGSVVTSVPKDRAYMYIAPFP